MKNTHWVIIKFSSGNLQRYSSNLETWGVITAKSTGCTTKHSLIPTNTTKWCCTPRARPCDKGLSVSIPNFFESSQLLLRCRSEIEAWSLSNLPLVIQPVSDARMWNEAVFIWKYRHDNCTTFTAKYKHSTTPFPIAPVTHFHLPNLLLSDATLSPAQNQIKYSPVLL